MSHSLQVHSEALSPEEESLRAIERTRGLLDNALTALDAQDDEHIALAYERAAECADTIARALWFLHRMTKPLEPATPSP